MFEVSSKPKLPGQFRGLIRCQFTQSGMTLHIFANQNNQNNKPESRLEQLNLDSKRPSGTTTSISWIAPCSSPPLRRSMAWQPSHGSFPLVARISPPKLPCPAPRERYLTVFRTTLTNCEQRATESRGSRLDVMEGMGLRSDESSSVSACRRV
jgi:hypothetical protein